jgi:hypothetical protein
MRHLTGILALLLSTSLACGAECSSRQAEAAERATDNIDSWQAAYRFYKLYRNCDDGGVAEGYADKIEALLAMKWRDLGDFLSFAKGDGDFEAFVLRHLGEITTMNGARVISANAEARCPRSGASFCQELVSRLGSSASSWQP